MAFDPVPYFVGGGAQHSAEVMRTLAYLATGGLEGIIGPLDFRTIQDTPPSGNVLVTPGGGVAVSKYPGVTQQSYIFRNLQDGPVAITPTGVGVTRSDLIIARVRDPSVSTSGDANPPSIPNGPYVWPEVVPNVPNTTRSVHQLAVPIGATAITLARIDIPANTAAITQAMIKDLRSLANSATKPQPCPEAEGSVEAEAILFRNIMKCGGSTLATGQTAFVNWPSEAAWTNVVIPKWCTQIAFFVLMNPQVANGDMWGDWRLTFDGVPTSVTDMDVNFEFGPGPVREVFLLGGVYTVPSSQRGKKVTVRSQAKMNDPALHPGSVVADTKTYVRVELDFLGVPSLS